MAKPTRPTPAATNRSRMLDSAKSLGRMIGELQRQLGIDAPGSRKKKRAALRPNAARKPKTDGQG